MAMVCAMMFTGCSSNAKAPTSASAQTTQSAGSEAASTASTSAAKQLVFAWSSPNMSNQFQVTLRDDVKKHCDDNGIKLLEADAQGDAAKQVSQVENFIAQGVNVILLSPTDGHACAPAVTAANKAGIPIMIINSTIDNLKDAVCYVGCNDTSAGEMEMQYIADKLNGKGNIVVLQGPDGNSAAVLRTAGIANILKKYPDIKVLAQQPANWDISKAMSIVENLLQTMDIDAVVSENDEMALGTVKAIEGQAVKKKILSIGVDAIPDGLKAVKEGKMIATVLQDAEAIAAKTIDVAQQVAAGTKVETNYEIPFKIIDSANIDTYLK
jgi:inositol transport system substrate-binding protein